MKNGKNLLELIELWWREVIPTQETAVLVLASYVQFKALAWIIKRSIYPESGTFAVSI